MCKISTSSKVLFLQGCTSENQLKLIGDQCPLILYAWISSTLLFYSFNFLNVGFVVRNSSVSEGIPRIQEGSLPKQRVTDSDCLGKKEMIILRNMMTLCIENNGIGKSTVQARMLWFIAKGTRE